MSYLFSFFMDQLAIFLLRVDHLSDLPILPKAWGQERRRRAEAARWAHWEQ